MPEYIDRLAWLKKFENGREDIAAEIRTLRSIADLLQDVGLEKIATRVFDSVDFLDKGLGTMNRAISDLVWQEVQRANDSTKETMIAMLSVVNGLSNKEFFHNEE